MICFLLDGFTSCTMPLEQSTVFSPFIIIFWHCIAFDDYIESLMVQIAACIWLPFPLYKFTISFW